MSSAFEHWTCQEPHGEKTRKEVSVLDVGGKPQKNNSGKTHAVELHLKTQSRVKARSHCNENDNDHVERERVLLVELLHPEYAHAHSTNGTRSLGLLSDRYRCSGTEPLVPPA